MQSQLLVQRRRVCLQVQEEKSGRFGGFHEEVRGFILFLIVDKSLKFDRALSPTEGRAPTNCANPGLYTRSFEPASRTAS